MADSAIRQIQLPPTIIVRHPRERTQKCSIWPLRNRSDLLFLSYPPAAMPCLDGYIRLDPEGPELSPNDSACGLLLLDGSWRWAGVMTKMFEAVPPRSLRAAMTAYPRVSKRNTDPPTGLASVEALYLAYHMLGRPTVGLLDHYRWRDEFLRANDL